MTGLQGAWLGLLRGRDWAAEGRGWAPGGVAGPQAN